MGDSARSRQRPSGYVRFDVRKSTYSTATGPVDSKPPCLGEINPFGNWSTL